MVTHANKWRWVGVAYGIFSVGYLVSGRLHLGEPATWPALPLDDQMPFLSHSIWIYWSQFGLLAAPFVCLRASRELTLTLWSMLIASLLAFGVFMIAPVHFPRIHGGADGLTGLVYQITFAFDRPTNCFPSLHACLASLAAYGLRHTRFAFGAWLWTGLILISTMTTKQHYLLDVVAGVALAAGVRAFLDWMWQRREQTIPMPKPTEVAG